MWLVIFEPVPPMTRPRAVPRNVLVTHSVPRSQMISLRRQPAAPGIAAREFVDSALRAVARETDATGHIPDQIVDQMRELGYFGLTIPEEYGGVGLGLVEYLEVVRELARTNAAFQELTEENNGIGSAALLIAGSEEQKQEWLPRLATGEALGSFAVTEPNAGSDVAAIQTTARKVEGGYLLNGTKHFITHGSEAGLITVVARLMPSESSIEFGLFLVTPGMDGFKVARLQPMMGYRASGQAELVFNDVFVPTDAMLGEPGDGFRTTMQTLDRGRLTVAADCLGAAEELLDRTIEYAKVRTTFGRALARRGEIRAMIATAAIDLFCIESALYEFAECSDTGENIRAATARVKLFASEAASQVADRAMQIHGGVGYTTEAEIERYFRDLRVMRIAEGASEVMRISIASAIRRALNGPHSTSIVSLGPPGDALGSEADDTGRLLRMTEGKLRDQALADLDPDQCLSEVRDARLADQAARWTVVDSARRRLAVLIAHRGESDAAEVARLGLYWAARRLAGDAVEGARLAAVASGGVGSYQSDVEELDALDRHLGTTDQVLDRVADGVLQEARHD